VVTLLVLAAAVLQIVTPLLPQIGIGQPIGARSDHVRTLITPAGWAFSIWGPLYAGSLAFAIYQSLARTGSSALLERLRLPAAGAFFGNAAWALWVQLSGLNVASVLIIFGTLACLLVIFRRLSTYPLPFTGGERWLVAAPFSALCAWLTAATIVNVAAMLRYQGFEVGDAAPPIAAAVIGVGGCIAGAALLASRGNPLFALVFLWALAAIYDRNSHDPNLVSVASIAAAIIVLTSAVWGMRGGGWRHWAGGSKPRK
jgi:hypothetical protein